MPVWRLATYLLYIIFPLPYNKINSTSYLLKNRK
nr:MAG TPA: hypothetical protein [Caudoviricetes sp.]